MNTDLFILSRYIKSTSHVLLSRYRYSFHLNFKKYLSTNFVGVIGLEVHAQIISKSKLFSGAGTNFDALTNDQVSPFDASLPGTLPVLNKRCVEAAVLAACALNCHINRKSYFDRKHYFYADLPAGYQITQYRKPIAVNGNLNYLFIQNNKYSSQNARITRIQIEQDSGRSIHDLIDAKSYIDLNRAGIGLLEIITEPDFSSGDDAACFVRELIQILKLIKVCDGKLERGSLRIDANISVHKPGTELGVRTEVKNINSVKNVAKAIEFEIKRQKSILKSGGKVENETRSFDSTINETVLMRDKEKVQDYRFLPEPNLPPLVIYDNVNKPKSNVKEDQIVNIDVLKQSLPSLPNQIRENFMKKYNLNFLKTTILINTDFAEFFELSVNACNHHSVKKFELCYNFLLNPIQRELNIRNCSINESNFKYNHLADIIEYILNGKISKAATDLIIQKLFDCTSTTSEIITSNKLWLINDPEEIHNVCLDEIKNNHDKVKLYKSGNEKVVHTMVNNIVTKSRGTYNPVILKETLTKLLNS